MGKDIVEAINERAKQGMDLIDQGILDKDLANRLKYEFMGTLVNALYTGKGSSVTKIVTVCLVAIITLALLGKFMIEGDVSGIRVVDILLGPGMLIGSYGAGKTVQKVMEKKYGNGNATNSSQSTTRGSRRLRPASSYRPDYDSPVDKGPSDTRRDHPGGH